MPTPLVSSFNELLLGFAPVFAQPSFENFLTLPFLFRLFRKKRKKRPPGRPKGNL